MRRIATGMAVSLVVLAGCSGGDDATDDAVSSIDSTAVPAPDTSGVATTTDDSEDAPPTTTAASADDDGADEPPATAPPTTVALIEGLAASIELLTPASETGTRPLLEWSLVDGASSYMATVYAPDGSPYWTWTGVAASVHVGGDPMLDESVPGPSVIDGMTWGVVAFNDEIVPIALSNRQTIAP